MIQKNQNVFSELEDFLFILAYQKMTVLEITEAHATLSAEFMWPFRTMKAIEKRIERLKKLGIMDGKNATRN